MSTTSVVLPVVAGAVGPAVDVSALAAQKTFVFSGVTGVVRVEGRVNGGPWCGITSFTEGQGDRVLSVLAEEFRVNATKGGATSAEVGAERVSSRAVTLPAPAGPGLPGAAADIRAFGSFHTAYVDTMDSEAVAELEISQDGVNFSQALPSLKANNCWESGSFDANYARVFARGGSVSAMELMATDSAVEALSIPRLSLVYRPGASGVYAPGGNIYTDWDNLMQEIESTKYLGWRRILFDDRFSPFLNNFSGSPACLIPAGTYDMTDVVLANSLQAQGAVTPDNRGTLVEFANDAAFVNAKIFEGPGMIMVGNNENGPSIILPDAENITLLGHYVHFTNTKATAAPMLAIEPGGGIGIIAMSSAIPELGSHWLNGGYVPTPAPVAQVDAGQVLILDIQSGYLAVHDNVLAGAGVLVAFWNKTGAAADPSMFDSPASQPSFSGPYVIGADACPRIQTLTPVLPGPGPIAALRNNLTLVDSTPGPTTVDLPPAGPRPGENVTVINAPSAGAAAITLVPAAGDAVVGATVIPAVAGASLQLYSDGGTTWYTAASA